MSIAKVIAVTALVLGALFLLKAKDVHIAKTKNKDYLGKSVTIMPPELNQECQMSVEEVRSISIRRSTGIDEKADLICGPAVCEPRYIPFACAERAWVVE